MGSTRIITGSHSILTVYLINDIVKIIKPPVRGNLFTDDFNILCKSNNLNKVQELFGQTNWFFIL